MEMNFTAIKQDAEKFFEKGTKSAVTRVRTNCQELKKQAQSLRLFIQEKKNEGK
jgi:hypothetical protein